MAKQKTDPPAQEFRTPAHLAGRIGVCRRTIYRAIRDGKIKAITFGASVMIPSAEVERVVAKGF
jgi:excisionase family DNA binding protein